MYQHLVCITLVRHGATEPREDICIGQLDVSLSEDGRNAVVEVANRWPGELPRRLFCSDLKRARETAALLRSGQNIELVEEPRLREINLGEWQGRHWDDIHRSDPQQLQRWGENWATHAPPAGETASQLCDRVADWYDDLQRQQPISTLVVAHAGSLAALACHLHRQPPARLFDYTFEHCAPLQLI